MTTPQHELLEAEAEARFEHHLDGIANGEPFIPIDDGYWDALLQEERHD